MVFDIGMEITYGLACAPQAPTIWLNEFVTTP